MDHQNQFGFGWLWTPSSGGNGILFCNPEQQAITTATQVPSTMMAIDNSQVVKMDNVEQAQHCGGGENTTVPRNGEIIPKNLSTNHSHNNSHDANPQAARARTLATSGSTIEGRFSKGDLGSSICREVDIDGERKSGNSKQVIEEEELARRRETNRLREKRRREQMTPKERSKARKKNRIRARKRRRNMTQEEKEQEKERNRERARQRRTQKLLLDGQRKQQISSN